MQLTRNVIYDDVRMVEKGWPTPDGCRFALFLHLGGRLRMMFVINRNRQGEITGFEIIAQCIDNEIKGIYAGRDPPFTEYIPLDEHWKNIGITGLNAWNFQEFVPQSHGTNTWCDVKMTKNERDEKVFITEYRSGDTAMSYGIALIGNEEHTTFPWLHGHIEFTPKKVSVPYDNTSGVTMLQQSIKSGKRPAKNSFHFEQVPLLVSILHAQIIYHGEAMHGTEMPSTG